LALPGRGGDFTFNACTTHDRNGRAELRRRYIEARRLRRATFERSELRGRAPSYAKDVTRGGCVVTGRVARPLRRAGGNYR
jgi:hypothetical protein